MNDNAFTFIRRAPTLLNEPPIVQLQSAASPAPVFTGVMVAFFIDPANARTLAIEGGEASEQLHLTLAYLGDVGEDIAAEDQPKLIEAVTEWAARTQPMNATVSGVGFFTAQSPHVTYASIDAPALPRARQDLVETLAVAGFAVNTLHGYTPHVTLSYEATHDFHIGHPQLEFSSVIVAFAGEHTIIPMTGLDQAGVETARIWRETTDRVPPEPVVQEEETARAFVADVGGRTLITGPATTMAALKDPTVEDIADSHLLWLHGKFVGADVPNRNGALWSAGDLEMSAASVTHGPLNWLHEARHVIGTLAKSSYVGTRGAQLAGDSTTPAITQPHITATAAIWKWIWPDEAYVVQQASDTGLLWFSMECISKEVACTGPDGCGNKTTYSQYMAGAACEHVTQRASIRQFISPVFLGGAVIVPPTRPGWAEADARVMTLAASMAEGAFEQAGQPDVKASDWEQMMAQLLRFGGQ